MKCQRCEGDATQHITEMVDGRPVEYHLCDEHAGQVDWAALKTQPIGSLHNLWSDRELMEAFFSARGAEEKLAAYVLPALCLGLVDENAEVRIQSACWMMYLGKGAASALGALRDALHDPHERVRKVAQAAIDYIEHLEAEQADF